MILSVTFDEDDVQPAAVEVRGGHAAHRRRGRPGRRDRLSCEALGIGAHRRARARAARLRDGASSRAFPVCAIIGTAPHKAAVVSFTMAGIHPHDIGTILDTEGVAVRTGHHCAMPVMDFFEVPATARASLRFYNTVEEIDRLVAALEQGARGPRLNAMDLKDLYRDVIVDHNRQPAELRPARAGRRARRRPQSAVRRPADGLRESRRRAHPRGEVRRQAAARSRSPPRRC